MCNKITVSCGIIHNYSFNCISNNGVWACSPGSLEGNCQHDTTPLDRTFRLWLMPAAPITDWRKRLGTAAPNVSVRKAGGEAGLTALTPERSLSAVIQSRALAKGTRDTNSQTWYRVFFVRVFFALHELLNPMTQANQLKDHEESNPDNAKLLLVYEAAAAAASTGTTVRSSWRNSLTCWTPNAHCGVGRQQWQAPVRRNTLSTGGPLEEKKQKQTSFVHMYWNRFEQQTTGVNVAQKGNAVPHPGAVLENNELHVTLWRNSITQKRLHLELGLLRKTI